jgi:hypothetical protein
VYYINRYERAKAKYINAQDTYKAAVDRKSELFQRTQPQAISIKADKITGGGVSNPLEDYMIAKDKLRLDDRIREAWDLLRERERILQTAERDLRQSVALYDRIYTARYLDAHSVESIARHLHYSERQIYRIIETINKKMAQNVTKPGI